MSRRCYQGCTILVRRPAPGARPSRFLQRLPRPPVVRSSRPCIFLCDSLILPFFAPLTLCLLFRRSSSGWQSHAPFFLGPSCLGNQTHFRAPGPALTGHRTPSIPPADTFLPVTALTLTCFPSLWCKAHWKDPFSLAFCHLEQSSGTFLKAVNLCKLDFPFWLLPVNLMTLLLLNFNNASLAKMVQNLQIEWPRRDSFGVCAAPYWLENWHHTNHLLGQNVHSFNFC